MTARKGLRAVQPNEKAPRRTAKVKGAQSVSDAVADGTQREQLVAMRSRIAKAIDEPNIRGADLAALSRRMLEITKEIDAIDSRTAEEAREGQVTPDDDWEAV